MKRPSVVYFVTFGDRRSIKIGKADDMGKRLKGLQTGNPEVLEVLAIIPGGHREEAELHYRFRHLRIRKDGEWFTRDCELLHYIRSLGAKGIECDCPRQQDLW